MDGKHDLIITRDFDLPVEILFKAYVEPEIVEQWMGTKVEKLESKIHGCYRFLTPDGKGNNIGFNGTIHDFVHNERITRTFEMENSPFPVQLEFLKFSELPNARSHLEMHIVFKSVEDRDAMLKLPFAQGINMAHNRLQEILENHE
ncbi:MAG: SRPBCC domain-containing protein [Crocinitomicaceae bacterium]